MQAASKKKLAKRRAKVVAAVEKVAGPLEFVNGGGTGSLESACDEAAVTEAAAGSGFLAPTLFDNYRAFNLRPASWFVLPATRRPKKGVVMVSGGGRIASGPAGDDRLPTPWYPTDLRYVAEEGPGEVQTPMLGKTSDAMSLRDPCGSATPRPAKYPSTHKKSLQFEMAPSSPTGPRTEERD